MIDLKELMDQMEEYMKTLDDQGAVESFTTSREYARTELVPFWKWLREKQGQELERPTTIVQNFIKLFGGRIP